MTKKLFELLLKSQRVSVKKRKNSGFTVLELLVAILISTFVVVALLDVVVDLLQTDRREYARNETQREMQMALDYMVNDLREAAYVYDYDGVNKVNSYLGFPGELKPILVFWKPEAIQDSELAALGTCSQFSDSQQLECRQLQVRRRAYSLVVYLQAENKGDDAKKWKGKSRILRFQLNRYESGQAGSLRTNTGYVAPNENNVSFQSWPKQNNGDNAPGAGGVNITTPPPPVLVDFVDHPTKQRSDNLAIPANPKCPDNTYTPIPDPDSNDSPKFDNPSFMVCVSKSSTGTTSPTEANFTNQDIFLFLRGNPTGKAGVKVAPLLAIKTQAVARGVIDKKPQ